MIEKGIFRAFGARDVARLSVHTTELVRHYIAQFIYIPLLKG